MKCHHTIYSRPFARRESTHSGNMTLPRAYRATPTGAPSGLPMPGIHLVREDIGMDTKALGGRLGWIGADGGGLVAAGLAGTVLTVPVDGAAVLAGTVLAVLVD